MRRFLAIASLLFLPFAACEDDTTGPSGPFSFFMTTELRDASIVLSDEQPYVCEYKCTATTQGGEKGENADWVSSQITWMIGDSAVFSFSLDNEDLFDRFGSYSIGRNQSRTFVRSASSHEPFDLKVVLNARNSLGEILSDSSSVTCDFPEDVMNFEQLEGTWTATKLKWTATESAVWWYDLILADGTLTFDLDLDGTFSGTTDFPVEAGSLTTLAVSGSLSLEDAITVTQANATFTFTSGPFLDFTGSVFRVADKLYFEATDGVTYDFNRDGTPDNATLEIIFELS